MKEGATSKRRFQSIYVFGGSGYGKDKVFTEAANELGKELASRKINLIYGGGIQGLKGCVAWSANTGGSQVLGITVKDLSNKSVTGFTLGTELKVSSMDERTAYIIYNAEAFIAVPGGVGTLEGISCIVSWAKLNLHQKPLGLLNTNGFYDSFLSFLDQAVEQGFVPQGIRHAILSAPTVGELIDQMQDFVPEPLVRKRKANCISTNDGMPDTILRL